MSQENRYQMIVQDDREWKTQNIKQMIQDRPSCVGTKHNKEFQYKIINFTYNDLFLGERGGYI